MSSLGVANIDTAQPIIRFVQSLDQYSYFGFSLVIHRMEENPTNFTQYIQSTRYDYNNRIMK